MIHHKFWCDVSNLRHSLAQRQGPPNVRIALDERAPPSGRKVALCMSALPRSKVPQHSRGRAAGQPVELRLAVRWSCRGGASPLRQATAA